MKYSLTPRQSEALAFIKRYASDNNGVAPTYNEICNALGLAAKSGAHRLVCSLKARGHIDFIPHCQQSITLL